MQTRNLILVCAGADSAAASRHGLPLLQLCLGVGRGGALRRLSLPARTEGCYLGVSDLGLTGNVERACAQSLLHEVKTQGMCGLFADLERDDPACCALLGELDRLLHAEGLPLFVPLVQADCVEHAMLVAEAAVSGGSLEGYLRGLLSRYPGRMAASLRPVSADFTLPAEDSEGRRLTAGERAALQQAHGAQAFFSRELCAKYFTYMDDAEAGHFVLYDDPATLAAKLDCLAALGVGPVFALYPDAAPLLAAYGMEAGEADPAAPD